MKRLLLRGNIVNRTCGTDKNLYISLFLPTIFGSIYHGPPKYQNYYYTAVCRSSSENQVSAQPSGEKFPSRAQKDRPPPTILYVSYVREPGFFFSLRSLSSWGPTTQSWPKPALMICDLRHRFQGRRPTGLYQPYGGCVCATPSHVGMNLGYGSKSPTHSSQNKRLADLESESSTYSFIFITGGHS